MNMKLGLFITALLLTCQSVLANDCDYKELYQDMNSVQKSIDTAIDQVNDAYYIANHRGVFKKLRVSRLLRKASQEIKDATADTNDLNSEITRCAADYTYSAGEIAALDQKQTLVKNRREELTVRVDETLSLLKEKGWIKDSN